MTVATTLKVIEVPAEIVEMQRVFLKVLRTPPLGALTVRQINMLLQSYGKPSTVGSLHTVLGVDKPALSRGADVLEALGLITRREHDLDKRVVFYDITAEGKKVLRKLAGI